MPSKEEIHSLSLSGHLGLLWLFLILFTGSCVTDSLSELEPGWNLVGLEGVQVNVIQPDGDGLLVGTEEGLFRWTSNRLRGLGLDDLDVRGVVRLKDNTLIAGGRGDPGIVWSHDEGATWQSLLNNFERENREERNSWALAGPMTITPLSDTLVVRTSGRNIVWSTNGGQTWELAAGQWGGFNGHHPLLKFDPYHPGRVWDGGISAISQVNLFN